MRLVLCPLQKDELSRYLSCYLKSDCNNGYKVSIGKRRKKRKYLPVSAVEGTYSAGGLELSEVSIDNHVARVHMERLNERDVLRLQASLLLTKKRPRRPKDGDVPTLRELCEDFLQTLEPPVKRRRGRPPRQHDNIYQPKSLKSLCEQVLNQQSPRRRGRKRKRPLVRSPLPLKELCKAALERKKRGKKKKSLTPPTLKELCNQVLKEKKQTLKKQRAMVRSQRRKKFNKRLLGFADVPSVIKASYRDRLRLRKVLEKKPSQKFVKKTNAGTQKVVVRKPFMKQTKKIVVDSDSDDMYNLRPPIKTYKRTEKSNGSLLNAELESVFRLDMGEEMDFHEKSQINIKFTDLLKDIQKVSLPSAEWKIKIILYNQQISQIVFSNKSSPERCVNIYKNTKYYDISFDKTFVYFLGAPVCVNNLEDLNLLLKIVHTIKENDPVLQYIQK